MPEQDEGSKKIVWLFGAGLSKPLGGPLLEELFSTRFVAITHGLLPRERHKEVEHAAVAYQAMREAGLVKDAEDFLNVVDTACEEDNPLSPQCQSLLSKLRGLSGSMFVHFHFSGAPEEKHQLLDSARLQIALACESFVPETPEGRPPESWAFLRRWANDLLEPQDTIITFNYDRAVEWVGRSKVWTLLPGRQDLLKESELNQEGALLLKLHGSVDWWVESDGAVRHETENVRARLREAEDLGRLAIGVPGPGKSNLSTALLQPLWDKAREALRSADAVVMVGYRMPDTDGHAMDLVTGSLREAAKVRDVYPSVHLVLGPETTSQDHVRLVGYIENIVHKPTSWPAWAEGFFSSIESRGRLPV